MPNHYLMLVLIEEPGNRRAHYKVHCVIAAGVIPITDTNSVDRLTFRRAVAKYNSFVLDEYKIHIVSWVKDKMPDGTPAVRPIVVGGKEVSKFKMFVSYYFPNIPDYLFTVEK